MNPEFLADGAKESFIDDAVVETLLVLQTVMPILADAGGIMEYGKVYCKHVITSSLLEVQVESAQ